MSKTGLSKTHLVWTPPTNSRQGNQMGPEGIEPNYQAHHHMLILNAHYLHPVLVKRLADTDGRSSRLAASLLDESMESSDPPPNKYPLSFHGRLQSKNEMATHFQLPKAQTRTVQVLQMYREQSQSCDLK